MIYEGLLAACRGAVAIRDAEANGSTPRNLAGTIYTAVYAGGYQGVGAVPGEGIPPGQTDPAFVERVLRLVPDSLPGDAWRFVKIDADGVELERDGIRAVASRDDLVGSLEPGSSVRVRRASVLFGRVPGFLSRSGQTTTTTTTTTNAGSRLYLNIDWRDAPTILGNLARRFDELALPFEMKVLADPESYYRADAAVVYLATDRIHEAVQVCAEARHAGDLCTGDQVPLLTLELGPGMAVADEPDDVTPHPRSHGLWVTALLVRALEFTSDVSQMVSHVEEAILASGRSPSRPYQRPEGELSHLGVPPSVATA